MVGPAGGLGQAEKDTKEEVLKAFALFDDDHTVSPPLPSPPRAYVAALGPLVYLVQVG